MDSQFEKKYNELMQCIVQMHERNVKRTAIALRSLLIVPTVFLVMLFFTNSSKTIFLVLWIVSMFIIATILIVIEYQDFTLRKMVAQIDRGETAKAAIAESSTVSSGDPRAEAIREAIHSRHADGSSGFEYDNYEEERAKDE